MNKNNFQLVCDDLKRKGIPFTTHSEMCAELMQNPEYRKLCEEDEIVAEKRSSGAESLKSFQTRSA